MTDYLDRGVRLGGDERDYNHATDGEYKKLRAKADDLYKKRNQLSQQSQQAYKSGDKQKAHELSEKAKQIVDEAEGYNRQAAEYVFRAVSYTHLDVYKRQIILCTYTGIK